MAILHHGMALAVDDPDRLPRSLTVHFLRPPEAGAVTVLPVVERSGRSLSSVSARMEQDGRVLALGLGAFSKPWPGPELSETDMPSVDPVGSGDLPTRGPDGSRRGPPFMDRLIMQPRFGEPPFTGADSSETGGWLGLREERPVDAATILVLADAWWPAPWPRLNELKPAPTVDMTVHFRAPLPLPHSALLGRFQSSLVQDGFFDEDGVLWAPDGTVVAQSRQLGLLLSAQN